MDGREPTNEEQKQDIDFLVKILFEIRDYAKACGQEPDDTIRAVAEWMLTLLEVSTFNGG